MPFVLPSPSVAWTGTCNKENTTMVLGCHFWVTKDCGFHFANIPSLLLSYLLTLMKTAALLWNALRRGKYNKELRAASKGKWGSQLNSSRGNEYCQQPISGPGSRSFFSWALRWHWWQPIRDQVSHAQIPDLHRGHASWKVFSNRLNWSFHCIIWIMKTLQSDPKNTPIKFLSNLQMNFLFPYEKRREYWHLFKFLSLEL